MSTGVNLIRSISEANGFDCALRSRGYLNMAERDDNANALERAAKTLDAIGMKLTRRNAGALAEKFATRRFRYGVSYANGLASINPAQLVRGLKQAVLKRSVRIFENTKALRIDGRRNPIVATEFGEIRAEHAVLSVNAYAREIGYFADRYLPVVSSIVATEPLSDEQLAAIGYAQKELIWSDGADAPMHKSRRTIA